MRLASLQTMQYTEFYVIKKIWFLYSKHRGGSIPTWLKNCWPGCLTPNQTKSKHRLWERVSTIYLKGQTTSHSFIVVYDWLLTSSCIATDLFWWPPVTATLYSMTGCWLVHAFQLTGFDDHQSQLHGCWLVHAMQLTHFDDHQSQIHCSLWLVAV